MWLTSRHLEGGTPEIRFALCYGAGARVASINERNERNLFFKDKIPIQNGARGSSSAICGGGESPHLKPTWIREMGNFQSDRSQVKGNKEKTPGLGLLAAWVTWDI